MASCFYFASYDFLRNREVKKKWQTSNNCANIKLHSLQRKNMPVPAVTRSLDNLVKQTQPGSDQRKRANQSISARDAERRASGIGTFNPHCWAARCGEIWRGEIEVELSYHGEMDLQCPDCFTYFYAKEVSGKDFRCCKAAHGRNEDMLKGILPAEWAVFGESSDRGKYLHENRRQLNNALAFASMKLNTMRFTSGTKPLRIQGQVHRYLPSSVKPMRGKAPVWAEIWFVDPQEQLEHRENFLDHYKAPGECVARCRLRSWALARVHDLLKTTNPYARHALNAQEIMKKDPNNEDLTIVYDSKRIPAGEHAGTYNLPTAVGAGDHVAAIFTDNYNEEMRDRGVVLTSRETGSLHSIHYLNRNFDPLHYVIAFPTGRFGYQVKTPARGTNKTVSALEFYKATMRQRYRAKNISPYTNWQKRTQPYTESEHLLTGGRLYQEYVIDAYKKTIDQRLDYLAGNLGQRVMHSYKYGVARDDQSNGNAAASSGTQKPIVLPSSFVGSPRDYGQRYQDALAMVRENGKPDMFITMTCNPRWREITDEMLPGEKWEDKFDLCCRVFRLKLKQLVGLIEDGCFGSLPSGSVTVVEFQKRGLPHAHLLVCLQNKLTSRQQYDAIVSAEIPGVESPELRKLVLKHMIHRPCDAKSACRQNNSDAGLQHAPLRDCSKGFPKDYQESTDGDPVDSYPTYKRRSKEMGGNVAFIHKWRTASAGLECDLPDEDKLEVDNSWVVPYSPFLLLTFDCHINVEVTSGIESVKYLYKYVYKGTDRIMYSMRKEHKPGENNEVEKYRAARYLTAPESYWCLFYPSDRFAMYPPVIRLCCHTEDNQTVSIVHHRQDTTGSKNVEKDMHDEDEHMENALAAAVSKGPPVTQLTGYFTYNLHHRDTDLLCAQLLYTDFPAFYTWKVKNNDKQWVKKKFVTKLRGEWKRTDSGWKHRANSNDEWTRRSGGHGGWKHGLTIGRMYRLTPSAGDAYYLKILLGNARGATAYAADDVSANTDPLCHVDESFRESCVRRAIITDNDDHWHLAMEDSVDGDTGHQPRQLLAMIIAYCYPVNPRALFDAFEGKLLEPYEHYAKMAGTNSDGETLKRKLLRDLHRHLDSLEFENERGLPACPSPDSLTDAELLETARAMGVKASTMMASLDGTQRHTFDEVVKRIADYDKNENAQRSVFINAGGGAGKTYLLNCILCHCLGLNLKALATASTGVAATLLEMGTTFHSATKAFVDNLPTTAQCFPMAPNSAKARALLAASVIIIDEATMLHHIYLDCLDVTLQAFCKNNRSFGGKLIILGGDFRQCLPVVKNGSDGDVEESCLLHAECWNSIDVMTLTGNHRQTGDGDKQRRYRDEIDKIGRGVAAAVCTGSSEVMLPAGVSYTPEEGETEDQQIDKLLDWLLSCACTIVFNEHSETVNCVPHWQSSNLSEFKKLVLSLHPSIGMDDFLLTYTDDFARNSCISTGVVSANSRIN